MHNRHYKRKKTAATFPRGLGKRRTCHPLEIVRRLYSKGVLSRTNLPAAPLKPVPNKAFRNLAHGVEGIQGWQANHGLCSIHAIAISWPNDPVTTLFSGAISSLAGRLDFLGRPSQVGTVTRMATIVVFAYTQNGTWNEDLTCGKTECVG